MRIPGSIAKGLVVAMAAFLLAAPLEAYYHYVHYSSRNAPFSPIYERFDLYGNSSYGLINKTVTFFVSDQSPAVFAPNDSFGSVLSQVKQAVAAWNSVPTSDLSLAFGGLECAGQHISNTPGGDVIFIDLQPGLLGLGAPTTSTTEVNGPNGPFFPIVRSTVMLTRDTTKATGPSYLEEFFTTTVHEIGHALGLQHTWTGSAMSQAVIRNTSRTRPLDADDIAGLSVLYGKPGWAASYGSINGRVTYANGTPVALASVVAIAPTGPAVSSLTDPNGNYTISGLPPNLSYLVYVHPLPPDAIASSEGIRLPVDLGGQPFQPASSAFQTVFYPSGTLNPLQATPTPPITPGAAVSGMNFSVQTRTAVPTYDVITESAINSATRTYTATGDTDVTPAFINITQNQGQIIASAPSPAFLPNPQSLTILGGFAPAVLNSPTVPTVLPFPTSPGWIAGYFAAPIGAGTGPRHLVFNFGTDIYVLPYGVDLVTKGPPVVRSLTTNPDGSVTVSGSGFDSASSVYFDGLKANTTPGGTFSGSDTLGSITVTPPQGTSGQTATITVYNTDGQNTMFLQLQNPSTYPYPVTGGPQINTVSVTALPAASSAEVDITASNVNFVDGQVTVGFGSDDVTVRRVWVASPTHLMANVMVSPTAAFSSSEISVINGFQVVTQPGAFQTQPARAGFPYIGLPIANADITQQTLYPGSIAAIYGLNLAQSPTSVQVTLNGQPVQLQAGGVLPNQVNFFIPAGFPTGLATLVLNNGAQTSFPVIVEIDNPPPTILAVTSSLNVSLASSSVGAGDILNVYVRGLDPTVLGNLSRLTVTISGVPMQVLQVSPQPDGSYQIQVQIIQSFGGAAVPLAVWVDGSSSQPSTITVR